MEIPAVRASLVLLVFTIILSIIRNLLFKSKAVPEGTKPLPGPKGTDLFVIPAVLILKLISVK